MASARIDGGHALAHPALSAKNSKLSANADHARLQLLRLLADLLGTLASSSYFSFDRIDFRSFVAAIASILPRRKRCASHMNPPQADHYLRAWLSCQTWRQGGRRQAQSREDRSEVTVLGFRYYPSQNIRRGQDSLGCVQYYLSDPSCTHTLERGDR